MLMAVSIPFALLLSGAVENYKRPLYAFAAVVMVMALVATIRAAPQSHLPLRSLF